MLQIVTIIGLGFIASGWAMQLTLVYQGKKDISNNFISFYIVGVVLLIIGAKDNGLDFPAILNIASSILATLLFIKLRK